MKRLAILLSMCVLSTSAFAGEVTFDNPAMHPAQEIDNMFYDNKDTNWMIHRLKPTDKTKTKPIEQKKSDDKITSQKETKTIDKKLETKKEVVSDIKKEPKKTLKSKTQTKETKETVTTVNPKEEQKKLKQEEERKLYRELQRLSDLNQQAIALYNDNNLDEALATFAKIPDDKRTPEIWMLMGNILLDKGKKDDAVFMYGRAIITDATYYKAYYNLGNVYLSDDKFNMAVEQYKLATKYNPSCAYAYYNLGCTYIKLGGVDAIHCEKLVQLIAEGKINTDVLISKEIKLSEIKQGYKDFENKKDNCMKIAVIND